MTGSYRGRPGASPVVAALYSSGVIRADHAVLDVGCGRGTDAVALAQWGVRDVCGIDLRSRDLSLAPRSGDVLYSREGARFGHAAIIPDGVNACLGQRMMLFRVNGHAATSAFFWATMSSSAVFRRAQAEVGGSASPHINVKAIRNFRVVRPPLALQRKYSDIYRHAVSARSRQLAGTMGSATLFASLVDRAFSGRL